MPNGITNVEDVISHATGMTSHNTLLNLMIRIFSCHHNFMVGVHLSNQALCRDPPTPHSNRVLLFWSGAEGETQAEEEVTEGSNGRTHRKEY